jgi:hypothetical protein
MERIQQQLIKKTVPINSSLNWMKISLMGRTQKMNVKKRLLQIKHNRQTLKSLVFVHESQKLKDPSARKRIYKSKLAS